MSIRIVPESERSPKLAEIAEIKLPPVALPYERRAARLRHLAQEHTMADYLQWAAGVCDAQQAAAQAHPLSNEEIQSLAHSFEHAHGPLDSGHWVRSAHWLQVLDALLAHLKAHAGSDNTAVLQAIDTLQNSSSEQRQAWADALLADLRGDEQSDETAEEAARADAGVAQLLWSALSVYWRQLASHLPAVGVADGNERHSCPVCSHAPVGSLVLGGSESGVRYLQCSLCESLWHVVRVMCSHCGEGAHLDYWVLDDEKSPIKAESCGDCDSYLKAFYQQTDQQLDAVADDLATLALDAEMEAKGIARSGVNPLMLPELA